MGLSVYCVYFYETGVSTICYKNRSHLGRMAAVFIKYIAL